MIETLDFEKLIEFLKVCRRSNDFGTILPSYIKAAVSKQTGKMFCKTLYNTKTDEIESYTVASQEVGEQEEYRLIRDAMMQLYPDMFERQIHI